MDQQDCNGAAATPAQGLSDMYDKITLRAHGCFPVQKTLDGGIDYCKRKVNLIAANLNDIGKVSASTVIPNVK